MITDRTEPISQSISQIACFMYYQSQMRRALAISLILFFSLGPLTAGLGASEDDGLPACCHRRGAHHCAMSLRVAAMMAEAAQGKAIVTAPATCPAFPGYAAATTTTPQAMAAAPVTLPVLLAQPHTLQAGRAAARLSQIRTRAGRGPPTSALI
jgi:hypothetical protein